MPVPVKLKIRPASLNFGSVKVGSHKGPRSITVSNPKGSQKHPGVTALMLGVNGEDGPFNITNGCNAPLPPGGSCNIAVTFAPTAGGPFSETLKITDNAQGSPQSVKLKGKGKTK